MGLSDYKAQDDFRDSLQLLQDSLDQYYEGKKAHYRTIAVQIWILLCDGDVPLVRRVLPEFKLLPLIGTKSENHEPSPIDQLRDILGPNHLFFPLKIVGTGKSVPKVEILFDKQQDPIELTEWFDQAFLNKKITIRRFLKSVRHKLGAHSDPDYDEILRATKSLRLTGIDSLELVIVSLGEYIINEIQSHNNASSYVL